MAHATTEPYRIPPVFAEAHARGFAGLPLATNPDKLLDPATGQPVDPEAYSHETVLKRRAPNANKRTAQRMLKRLEEARPTPRR